MSSIETQLFTWQGWDVSGVMSYQFYDCTLLKDIGPIEAGTFIHTILIDYEQSEITLLGEDDEDGHVFKLGLTITN